MCWMCVEQQQSDYRTCDGCNELKEVQDLEPYDLFKKWRELAEFVNQKRFVLFCSSCVEEMDKYRDYIVQQKPRTAIMINGTSINGISATRHQYEDSTISVGIHCTATQMTYGLRCAKRVYGYDATEEILQGFAYYDDQGHRIKRLTLQDVDEKVICDKCWLPLDECNAREVSSLGKCCKCGAPAVLKSPSGNPASIYCRRCGRCGRKEYDVVQGYLVLRKECKKTIEDFVLHPRMGIYVCPCVAERC